MTSSQPLSPILMKSVFATFLSFVVILFLAFATQVVGQSEEDQWIQWRGNDRDGIDASTKWPGSIDDNRLKKKWRIGLGPSYSGPIVHQDRVYVTETKDKKYEVVRALDRKTGKQIWSQKWEGAMTVPFFAKANGDWIRATPAYADGRLFVAGMKDLLVCLRATDGKILWRVDFPKLLGSKKPEFGFVSSPLVDQGHVYVQAGGGFCKIDIETGKIVWKTLNDGGGMYGSAFSSPVIAKIQGKRQLLVQTRDKLNGIDIKSGQPLWSVQVPSFRGMNILTPTVFENSIFTSTYQKSSYLYSITKSGEGFDSKLKWQNRMRGYMTTPVIVDGHAYFHLQNQCLACIDLSTGEEKWKSKRFGKYSSLVTQGDRILALDQKGQLIMFRANPEEFELIGTRKISSQETWAHLAVCGGQVFIRELNAMAVYDWQESSAQQE